MPVHPQGGTDSQLLAPTRAAATAVLTSSNLDTRGASYASIRVQASSGATTDSDTVTVSVQESDDTAVTNFATIVADATIASSSTDGNLKTYHIDLRGRKRYLRVITTPSTVASDDAVSVAVSATLFRKGEWPGAVGEMSDTAAIIV